MIQIQLQKFEGPLDLLLYLIRKEEMDIFDIQIHLITKQYLDYTRLMQELDIETAGDFISLASTLIQIKSRMLLPQYDENGEIIEQEDPRKELVQRLLEYEKYKEAAQKLYERPLLNRDTWARGVREKMEVTGDEILLEENALFSLISSYRFVVKSMKKRIHKVSAKAQSIASRILEMKDLLAIGVRRAMSELITVTEDRKRQVLITFLSLLELGKMEIVGLYQTENFTEIYVEAKKSLDGDAISRVEEYDSVQADDVAANMMAKAEKMRQEEMLFDEEESSLEKLASETDEAVEMVTDEEILAAEVEINSGDLRG